MPRLCPVCGDYLPPFYPDPSCRACAAESEESRMAPSIKAALRSFLTTFIATFLALVPVAAVVEGDFTWVTAALVSAGTAALRTLLAALDPGQPLYGVGSQPPA